jgi:hypothetical protein
MIFNKYKWILLRIKINNHFININFLKYASGMLSLIAVFNPLLADSKPENDGVYSAKSTVFFYFNKSAIPTSVKAVDALLPYVAYLSSSGTITGCMFHRTILIDLKTGKPSKASWMRFLERALDSSKQDSVFPDGRSPVQGLTDAVEKVSRTIDAPELKHGVILTIPWSNVNHGEFGDIDQKLVQLDSASASVVAAKWFVDEALQRWKSLPAELRQRLYLDGFYWLAEAPSPYFKKEDQLQALKSIAMYIQSKGLRFYLSPYNRGFERPSYDSAYFEHFDSVWLQPNAWPTPGAKNPHWATEYAAKHVCQPTTLEGLLRDGVPVCEVDDMVNVAVQHPRNVTLNIEWREAPNLDQDRVVEYIERVRSRKQLLARGFAVYEDGGQLFQAARSDHGILRRHYRAMYDLIEKLRFDEKNGCGTALGAPTQ